MKRNVLLSMLVVISLAILTGCNKSDSDGKSVLQVMLTDAPAEYDQVLIDIQDVQIHRSSDENDGEWISLDVNSGVYNLLDFRNGMDTLLATIELPAGEISQMRLVLGENNQLKIGEDLFDLMTPSGQQSGLKFNIHANLEGGFTYKLWIDFDAARSVVEKGNGEYSLKPVIRTFTEAVSGAISGVVSPAESLPHIMAVEGTDTLSTFAGADGNFMINGVKAGSWTVYFDPVDPFVGDTINVDVQNGIVTEMDTVYFSQP
ncbi:MAG TPA: DUF4382 domain-containing protein [Bacteroidales bacterium]|jgi:hypothetical protein|nr:DUF4382 domain-containing protein [Bacteroidales bacterium]